MILMPRDEQFDSTVQLLRNPYDYIGKICAKFGTDIFEARLLFQRTVCMTGPEAAQLFYDPQRFQHLGAAPEPLGAPVE